MESMLHVSPAFASVHVPGGLTSLSNVTETWIQKFQVSEHCFDIDEKIADNTHGTHGINGSNETLRQNFDSKSALTWQESIVFVLVDLSTQDYANGIKETSKIKNLLKKD